MQLKKGQQKLIGESYKKAEDKLFPLFNDFFENRYEKIEQKLQKKTLKNIAKLAKDINECIELYGSVYKFKQAMFKHVMKTPHNEKEQNKDLDLVIIADMVFDDKFPEILKKAGKLNSNNTEKLNQLADNLYQNIAQVISKSYKEAKKYIQNEKYNHPDHKAVKNHLIEKDIEHLNEQFNRIIDNSNVENKGGLKHSLNIHLETNTHTKSTKQNKISMEKIKNNIISSFANKENITGDDIKTAVQNATPNHLIKEESKQYFEKHMIQAVKDGVKSILPYKYQQCYWSKFISFIKNIFGYNSKTKIQKTDQNIQKLNDKFNKN